MTARESKGTTIILPFSTFRLSRLITSRAEIRPVDGVVRPEQTAIALFGCGWKPGQPPALCPALWGRDVALKCVRAFGLRRERYRGLVKAGLQTVATAA